MAMSDHRKLTRRSFLGRVTGGMASGALVLTVGLNEEAGAEPSSDFGPDKPDSLDDPDKQRRRNRESCSDSDTGRT